MIMKWLYVIFDRKSNKLNYDDNAKMKYDNGIESFKKVQHIFNFKEKTVHHFYFKMMLSWRGHIYSITYLKGVRYLRNDLENPIIYDIVYLVFNSCMHN